MTDSPLASSFRQAAKYLANPGRHMRVIVMHDMEAPEGPTTAENCQGFFTTPAAGGSAHYCVDTDSIAQCVREADQAAGAPGANQDGIHIELCGYARQTREEWLDDTSRDTCVLAAALVRDIGSRRGIPLRWLTDEELAEGAKGITTHAAVSRVYRKSDHTDPGPEFPVDAFMAVVLGPDAPPAPTPKPRRTDNMRTLNNPGAGKIIVDLDDHGIVQHRWTDRGALSQWVPIGSETLDGLFSQPFRADRLDAWNEPDGRLSVMISGPPYGEPYLNTKTTDGWGGWKKYADVVAFTKS